MGQPPACGESLCAKWAQAELLLAVPQDALERWNFWKERKERYLPWFQGVWLYHDWSFLKGTCLNCGLMETTCLRGRSQTICVECLTTEVPWYPTGHLNPKLTIYAAHMKECSTSHS